MASAKRTALPELTGQRPEGLRGQAAFTGALPEITPELQEGLKQSVWILAQTTKPNRHSMPELMDLFKAADRAQIEAFGGEENVKMNLKVWGEVVGDFPLSAVSKAVR